MNVNGCSILSVMSKFQGGDEEKAEVGGRKGPTTVPWREKVGSPFRSAVLLGLGSSPGIGPCQFLSPRGPDGLPATSQLAGRRDVGNRAIQAHFVVIVDELGDQPPSVLQGQGRRGANALQGTEVVEGDDGRLLSMSATMREVGSGGRASGLLVQLGQTS